MANPLDNIFGNSQEDEKDKLIKNPANSSQSRTVSADPLENIFANKTKETPKQVQVENAVKKEEPKQSFFDKAVSVVGKVATSVGNFFSEQSRKNAEASLPLQELMSGRSTIKVDPTTGKKTISSPRLDAYNTAKTPEEKAKVLEEAQQDVPLIKFLNTDTGKKITGTIYNTTSNIPLKTIARIKSLGDDTYDEAYSALVAKSKDPNNSRFEKIMYGLQDSGVQSAIGALLAVGTTVLLKNPNAGRAVSLAYFASISAESQRQDNEKGNVTSIGNIAIDTVGDTLISGFAESALKTVIKEGGEAGLKAFAKQLGKGFLVEGGTEPTQTFLKYANDYRNAKTEAQRQAVVAKVTEYVKSGGMVDEFLIGGLSGAGITGVATGVGKVTGGNVQVDPSLQSDGNTGGSTGTKKGELNIDFSEIRDEIVSLETAVRENPRDENAVRRLTVANDQLNDYQQAVKQRPIYIADDTQETPLATVETVQYPDGKFSYSFSANAEGNSVQSPFINTETFKTQKQAIEAGKKAILDWVNSKIATAEGVELAKLNEIKSEIENPTKPNGVKVSLNRDAETKTFKGQEVADIVKELGSDGGVSDFLYDQIKSKNYIKKKVNVQTLLDQDPDLKEYIETSKGKLRKYKGSSNPNAPIVVSDKQNRADVLDGYNRIARAVKNGNTEIDAYVSDKLNDDGKVSDKEPREILLEEAKKYDKKEDFVKSQINAYHGTPNKEFKEFKLGMRNNTENETNGLGVWVTPQESVAKTFSKKIENAMFGGKSNLKDVGGTVMGVSVQLKNPKVYTSTKGMESILEEIEKLEKEKPSMLSTSPNYETDADKRNEAIKKRDEISKQIKELRKEYRRDAFEHFMDERDQFAEYIEPNAKWEDRYVANNVSETNKKFIEYLKKQGYDGINIVGTEYDAKEAGLDKVDQTVAFDPKSVFTKYQLEQIWNEANKSEKQIKPEKEKVSKNVEKTRAGVYRVTQYNAQGEAQGKAEARFTRSKRNGKMFFEVTKDGERIERLPLDKAKKKYGTTDRPTMVERAVNGKLNKQTGKWELRQSNAPVIRNTTQNQVEKKPVKTKGKVKQSKAFQRVQERLGEYADIDVNYNKLNLADDTARALEFIEKNPKEAKRIALGMQGAPEGVTETAISIALAEQASEKGDYALQAQLERSRSLRQTRRGQEIVSERGRFNENSPHFFMQQVLASRIEKAGKEKFRFLTKKKGERSSKTVDGKLREGTDNIKKTVRKKLTATDLAQNVIDSLTC